MMHKKSIIKNTAKVGASTLLSRAFGVIRELLMVRYLGAGVVSDAFVTAFKIPNSLRKIFAEGALSTALVPSLVAHIKKDRDEVPKMMTLAFVIFEGAVLVLCAIAMFFAPTVINLAAPGFSPEQVAYAVPFLRILMPFIFFVSSSAILAGALQAVGHFFVPAFAPVLLNIVLIIGLFLCLAQNLAVDYFCYAILVGGLAQFIAHLIAYWQLKFTFEMFDRSTWHAFKGVLWKFLPCLFSMSVAEVSLFVDTAFASYLPKGSISLLYYANRFMGIPLGVFAVALSTILLPHFTRISLYAPKRLSYYLLESAKLVFWVTFPATILMSFFAQKIFYTMFYSPNFSMEQVVQAHSILIAFVAGLFFYSLNKILMSMYYALHNTTIPAIIAVIATVTNIILNVIFMYYWQAVGLAWATTLSAVLQTVLLVWCLRTYFKFTIYIESFMAFVLRYVLQIFVLFAAFFMVYQACITIISRMSDTAKYVLLDSAAFWLWAGPLACLSFLVIFKTKKTFKIHTHFLD